MAQPPLNSKWTLDDNFDSFELGIASPQIEPHTAKMLRALCLFLALTVTTAVAAPNPNNLITMDGIGSAKLGMTLPQLKKKLGKGYTFKKDENFMVDIEAIHVMKGNEVLYTLLFMVGEPQQEITWMVTSNPYYKLAEGVGPGSPLMAAEKAYGEPYLSFSNYDEQREWIRFQTGETKFPFNLSLRAKLPGDDYAGQVGEYPNYEKDMKAGKEFFETIKYNPNAVVDSVWVSLEEGGC